MLNIAEQGTKFSMLRKSKSAYFKRLNPKDVKKAVKYLNKIRIPPLVEDDFIANSYVDKTNMLNSFFSSCFNSTHSPIREKINTPVSENSGLMDIDCTVEEIFICYLIFRWVKQVDLKIYHLVC